jgi:hypothetical protein
MSVVRRRDYKNTNCLYLDGVDSYVSSPIPWNYTGPVTVEYSILVNSADVKESTIIQFAKEISTSNRFLVHSPFSDSNLYFDYGNSSDGRISTDLTTYLGSWASVKLYSGGANGDKREITLNNTVVNTLTGSNAPSTSLDGLEIGAYRGNTVGTHYFKGAVRDLKIWQGATLVLDMPLRSNYSDYSGNNYDGTPFGGAKFIKL